MFSKSIHPHWGVLLVEVFRFYQMTGVWFPRKRNLLHSSVCFFRFHLSVNVVLVFLNLLFFLSKILWPLPRLWFRESLDILLLSTYPVFCFFWTLRYIIWNKEKSVLNILFFNWMAVLRAINKRLTIDKFLTNQDLSRLFFFLPSSGRDILYQFKIKNQR